ncbi:MAG: hypothetical protein KAZ38_22020 [Caldilineaceae bacterium]|nr:hypothetical protein [Caldilineaceae bacterium]
MVEALLVHRVDRLEDLMAQLLRAQTQTQRQVDQTSFEMRLFKDEMRTFKDEMRDFKDEMRTFKEEMRQESREMNRRWGELANKMGTLAEDLVAPSIPRIARTVLGCADEQIDSIAVRVRRRAQTDASRRQEFDVVAACGPYLLVNETKSNLNVGHIKTFVTLLPTVRDYFPEYADRQVIGAIASLYVDDSLRRHAEKQGLIVLGFGEDVMDVLNSPGFVPKAF